MAFRLRYVCEYCGKVEAMTQIESTLKVCSCEQKDKNGHIYFKATDFDGWTFEQKSVNYVLIDNVVNGGLAICKICGEYEAGLDIKCTGNNDNNTDS